MEQASEREKRCLTVYPRGRPRAEPRPPVKALSPAPASCPPRRSEIADRREARSGRRRDRRPTRSSPRASTSRLGKVAYRIRASFLPGPNATVRDKLAELKFHEIDLTKGAVLEAGCVYLVPLIEQLKLARHHRRLRQSEKLDRAASTCSPG